MDYDISKQRGTYHSGCVKSQYITPCGRSIKRGNSEIKNWERLHLKVCPTCASVGQSTRADVITINKISFNKN